jgi:hypothetical protein
MSSVTNRKSTIAMPSQTAEPALSVSFPVGDGMHVIGQQAYRVRRMLDRFEVLESAHLGLDLGYLASDETVNRFGA